MRADASVIDTLPSAKEGPWLASLADVVQKVLSSQLWPQCLPCDGDGCGCLQSAVLFVTNIAAVSHVTKPDLAVFSSG